MNAHGVRFQSGLPQPQRPTLELIKRATAPASMAMLRAAFWIFGILLASAQAWVTRYQLSADSVSYLDMSDAVLPGFTWHRLINGVWSPLYPLLLGVFRRMFQISPGNEIAAGHLLNIGFFIFSFVCFEFFLVAAMRELESSAPSPAEGRLSRSLPWWAYLSVGYALFLWGAIGGISLTRMRPDMLMSGFLYLAVGVLLRMRRAPANWTRYIALGAILGFGYLAKAPMLPIGILILTMTLLAVADWRPALKMTAATLALMVLIGSFYFVPLSRQRGFFTLGQSGAFNYVVHVDRASPPWYLQSPGDARGAFLRPPEKIFSAPAAYAFAVPIAVTHPLRFDPSYWLAGVRPRFVWQRQIRAVANNVVFLIRHFPWLFAMAAAIFVLAWFSLANSRLGWKQMVLAVMKCWPVWCVGLAGCAMYALVSIEPRYVAAFIVLLGFAMLSALPPLQINSRVVALAVIATVAILMFPVVRSTWGEFAKSGKFNADAQAANALAGLGIKPGDAVGRISPLVSDFGPERILRVQIAAEVDYAYASKFWSSSSTVQAELLHAFASKGAKAVIATSPALTAENQSEWTRLGSTQYWIWRPQLELAYCTFCNRPNSFCARFSLASLGPQQPRAGDAAFLNPIENVHLHLLTGVITH